MDQVDLSPLWASTEYRVASTAERSAMELQYAADPTNMTLTPISEADIRRDESGRVIRPPRRYNRTKPARDYHQLAQISAHTPARIEPETIPTTPPKGPQLDELEYLAPSSSNLAPQQPSILLSKKEDRSLKIEYLEIMALPNRNSQYNTEAKAKYQLRNFLSSMATQLFHHLVDNDSNDDEDMLVAMRRYIEGIRLDEDGNSAMDKDSELGAGQA